MIRAIGIELIANTLMSHRAIIVCLRDGLLSRVINVVNVKYKDTLMMPSLRLIYSTNAGANRRALAEYGPKFLFENDNMHEIFYASFRLESRWYGRRADLPAHYILLQDDIISDMRDYIWIFWFSAHRNYRMLPIGTGIYRSFNKYCWPCRWCRPERPVTIYFYRLV